MRYAWLVGLAAVLACGGSAVVKKAPAKPDSVAAKPAPKDSAKAAPKDSVKHAPRPKHKEH